ncbi:ATP-binding cassette domain-containing protein [Glaciimonas immobilis]|nr:ATP-binding cassette domain-containing protein [Glaciimonas immobilis]
MRIPPGVTLIRGGDGTGKTSLLRLLAGELPADAGRLQINDIDLADDPAAYRRQLFWTDARSEAFDQMTPIAYFTSMKLLYPDFDETLLTDLIEGLSLTPHLEKNLYMLSTGSKRKVWLAAAFASGAVVTLLDDPFAALDKASINFVMQFLDKMAGHGSRAWVVSHYDAPCSAPLAATIDLGD